MDDFKPLCDVNISSNRLIQMKTCYPYIFAYLEAETKEKVLDKARILLVDFTLIKVSENLFTKRKKP